MTYSLTIADIPVAKMLSKEDPVRLVLLLTVEGILFILIPPQSDVSVYLLTTIADYDFYVGRNEEGFILARTSFIRVVRDNDMDNAVNFSSDQRS